MIVVRDEGISMRSQETRVSTNAARPAGSSKQVLNKWKPIFKLCMNPSCGGYRRIIHKECISERAVLQTREINVAENVAQERTSLLSPAKSQI